MLGRTTGPATRSRQTSPQSSRTTSLVEVAFSTSITTAQYFPAPEVPALLAPHVHSKVRRSAARVGEVRLPLQVELRDTGIEDPTCAGLHATTEGVTEPGL